MKTHNQFSQHRPANSAGLDSLSLSAAKGVKTNIIDIQANVRGS